MRAASTNRSVRPPGHDSEYSRSGVIGIEGVSTYAASGATPARRPCIFGATIVTVWPARSRKRRCRRIDT